MTLITQYSHKCDRCGKVLEHRNVTLPSDWSKVQLNQFSGELCDNCTKIVKDVLEKK